ncbi:helix-turn-helix domain-containing protein [Variovorax paradoxus]|nr:helix-turn-helix domain-containing protein [Variovorax paradoxus]
MKRAYFLVLPHAHLLDLAGPLQIVATLKELEIAPVVVECISPQANILTFQEVALREIRPLPTRLEEGDVLFVIGSKLDDELMQSPAWHEAADWLRKSAADAKTGLQVCGVCTGTFLIAQSGLLDGRVCTTHHRFVRQLGRQFPQAHVVGNRVLVRDEMVWTSAGVASGIDLALHLIAQAYGADAAIQVARENVVHLRRFGSDPELSAPLRYRSHGNQFVHAVQDLVARNLARSITMNALAKRFDTSARQLARLFVAETGITIKRYQIELRLDLARRLLTDTTMTLDRLVERCGFGSVQAFRANWNSREALPPSALRKQGRRRTR